MLGGVGEDMDMEQFMESFEQCGIDVEEMSTKALGAFLLYGSDFADVDPTNPESFPGLDKVAPLLLALKDNDEKACSEEESDKLVLASQNYLQCSGINNFFDLTEIESGDLASSIEADCKPVFDMVLDTIILVDDNAAPIDEDEANIRLMELGKNCLETLLGDNSIGNFIRYEYNHFDKTLECIGKLGEDLPHCILSTQTQDGETISVPLSLEKKMACLEGSISESFTQIACLGAYEFLDGCLPQVGDDDGANDDLPLICGGDTMSDDLSDMGMDLSIVMDPSVITGNKMPDFCSGVFEEMEMSTEQLQSRLDYYNNNREYGWTLETISKGGGANKEVEAIPASPKISESSAESSRASKSKQPQEPSSVSNQAPEQPEEVYESNPDDVPSVESSSWANGEAESNDASDAKAKSFPFIAASLVLIAAVALALLVKYRGSRANPQRSEPGMKNVAYADLALKVEHSEMA